MKWKTYYIKATILKYFEDRVEEMITLSFPKLKKALAELMGKSHGSYVTVTTTVRSGMIMGVKIKDEWINVTYNPKKYSWEINHYVAFQDPDHPEKYKVDDCKYVAGMRNLRLEKRFNEVQIRPYNNQASG